MYCDLFIKSQFFNYSGALELSTVRYVMILFALAFKKLSQYNFKDEIIFSIFLIQNDIPHARHYNLLFVLFLPHFSFSLRFTLQTIYVLKTEILHFLSLKSTVYTRERLLISGLQWRTQGNCLVTKMCEHSNFVQSPTTFCHHQNLFRISLRWDLYPTKRWINNTVYYQIRTEDYGKKLCIHNSMFSTKPLC